MAGDWIKMRSELQTHPKVVRILSATQSDKFRVIGGLHAVWSVFDSHSCNGELFGYTPDLLDHVIGWPGFSVAMMNVSWLIFDNKETLVLPEFDEHNSRGAKRRAEDQKRKRNVRINSGIRPHQSGQNLEKKRTREEKRREEIVDPRGRDTTTVPSRPSPAKDRLRSTHIPEDFCPTTKTLDRIKGANCPEVTDDHVRLFVAHYTAAGTSSSKWQDKFVSWMIREKRFAVKAARHSQATGSSKGQDWIAEGKRLGVLARPGELMPAFIARVQAAQGTVGGQQS